MSLNLNINNSQWKKLNDCIKLNSFKEFLDQSDDIHLDDVDKFVNNYLTEPKNYQHFCTMITNSFSEALDLSINNQVTAYGDNVGRMLDFIKSKFNETFDKFIYYANKVNDSKKKKNAAEILTIIYIIQLRMKENPNFQ